MASPHTMRLADQADWVLMIAIHDALRRQLLVRLRTRLASHLAHEESDALPLINQVLSPGELSGIAAAIRGGHSTRRAGITVPWGPRRRQSRRP
jgi:hypothetical protein